MAMRTTKLVPERATSGEQQARGHVHCCEEVVWAGSLHEATRCGHKTIVANILENGALADTKDEGGSTALHVAAGVGEVGMVQLLLLKGAVLEAQDGAERRAVHVAAQAGHVGVTGALLAAGADAGARYGTQQSSALEVAAENGRAGVVKTMIEHGVNVNTADAEGSSPLHWAAYGGSAQVIDALAKAGACIDQPNSEGASPLYVAAVWRHLGAALALLKYGAEVNVTNQHQKTPLFAVAAFPGKDRAAEMVDLLLRWGADEGMTDNSGQKAGQIGWVILDFGSIAHGVLDSLRAAREQQRVRQLLDNAPADRAWRRRGLLVLCRAHPGRAQWRQQVSALHGNMTTTKYSRARLVSKLVDENDAVNAQRSSTTEGGSNGDGALRDEWVSVTAWLMELGEEGVFRRVVSYL